MFMGLVRVLTCLEEREPTHECLSTVRRLLAHTPPQDCRSVSRQSVVGLLLCCVLDQSQSLNCFIGSAVVAVRSSDTRRLQDSHLLGMDLFTELCVRGCTHLTVFVHERDKNS